MQANGPAIWGGCVTRREHRVGSWYPVPPQAGGSENCHGARRVWRGFCIQVQFFWIIRVSCYNFICEQVLSQVTLSLIGGRSGVRICLVLQSCPMGRSNSKNHDELMNYTVRVSLSFLFFS